MPLFGQNDNFTKWQELAEKDISLRPQYGNIKKTAKHKASDLAFKKEVLEKYDGDHIAASEKMVELGFTYLYDKNDFVTAMRRFNQAHMLNTQNADAYYGYGAIYFNLGAMDEARKQYEKGLSINPKHTKILTDYGTTYLGEYYKQIANSEEDAFESLNTADQYLEKSFALDKKNSNTVYKLSIVKMYLGNCKQAKALLKRAQKMDNPNITEAYMTELQDKCE